MCDDDRYWNDVACRFGQASWLTDVGLPLLFTLLSILAAYLFLTRQLRHDVKLRRAERREAVVRRFAEECIDLAEGMSDARRLPVDYWLSRRWPDWHRLRFAAKQVEWMVGEGPPFEEVVEAGRDLSHAWGACWDRLDLLRSRDESVDEMDHAWALCLATGDISVQILSAGRKLLSYDGDGPLPTFKPWPGEHLPPGESERDVWRAKYGDRYEHWLRNQQRGQRR